ncbi:MAG: hypothetical protein ABIB98_02080 [bacterium]
METDIELLRAKLKKLREKKDEIIFEKGMVAEDNNDLRENSLYDYLVQQEDMYSSMIVGVLKEIRRLSENNNK